MQDDVMEFECETCEVMFRDRLFEIAREYERVIFSSPARLDEVEIKDSENIANFCCSKCLDSGRSSVMAAQRVPIPAERPGIGPIESCAKCSGPVDMSDWHLTFVESEVDTSGSGFRPIDVKYLAVVCRKCGPFQAETASTETEHAIELAHNLIPH